MKLSHRIAIAAAVLIAVASVIAFKTLSGNRTATGSACCSASLEVASVTAAPVVARIEGLPSLVDLGAGKCIPCKMMAPILESLKTEQAGKLNVEFIDVWLNPDAGKQYGIEIIPTQIFYDAKGKERFRHVGFFAKEDILKKWKELGVELNATPGKTP